MPLDPSTRLMLDLTPLVFHEVKWKERVLVIDPPLSLLPVLDEDSLEFLIAEEPEVGLQVFASTRAALEQEIVEQLFFLWDEYAGELSDKLTPGAQQLQESLKKRMREESHAA